jgi:peptidoglycan/LPS O-acetylase OafA/YrhL
MDEIKSLTSLRGIAALLVVFLHYRRFIAGYVDVDQITHFFSNSWIWVDFFFMLSGFIMCHVYGDQFAESVTRARYKRFMLIRIFRIYPLHVFMLILFIGAELIKLWIYRYTNLHPGPVFSGSTEVGAIVTNLLMIHAWGIGHDDTWNVPSWSISVEFFLYLIFPFLVSLPLTKISVRMSLITLAFVLLFVLHNPFGMRYDFQPFYLLVRGLSCFVIGCCVYYSVFAGRSCRSIGMLRFFQLVVVIGLVFALHAQSHILYNPPLFALLIYLVSADQGPLGRVLCWSPFVWLGTISYSIYLGHALLENLLSPKLDLYFPKLAAIRGEPEIMVFVGLQVVAVIIFASLLYHFVEKPARRFLRARYIEGRALLNTPGTIHV